MFSLMATMLGAVQQVQREHARGEAGPREAGGAWPARVLPAALTAGVVVLVGVAWFYL
jgi:hypothetical protein